jgi:hypothetical protein
MFHAKEIIIILSGLDRFCTKVTGTQIQFLYDCMGSDNGYQNVSLMTRLERR